MNEATRSDNSFLVCLILRQTEDDGTKNHHQKGVDRPSRTGSGNRLSVIVERQNAREGKFNAPLINSMKLSDRRIKSRVGPSFGAWRRVWEIEFQLDILSKISPNDGIFAFCGRWISRHVNVTRSLRHLWNKNTKYVSYAKYSCICFQVVSDINMCLN